jgi:hypothetical protein
MKQHTKQPRVGINQSILEDSYLLDEPDDYYNDKSFNKPNHTTKFGASQVFDDYNNEHYSVKPITTTKETGSKCKLIQSNLADPMAFGEHEDSNDSLSVGNKDNIEKMSVAQIEVFSAQMNRERFYALQKIHTYYCFICLIAMQIVQTMQRAAISYMFGFQTNNDKNLNPHYNIRMDIPDLTPDNFSYIAGDAFTIICAFLTLFFGSASDLMNRKWVLCVCAFMWSLCTYLSGFANSFNELFALRLLTGFF